MATLNEKQLEMSSTSKWDFGDLKALFINCTLKPSPELSHTQGLIDVSKAILEKNGVSVEVVRAVDYDIAYGVWPDMDLPRFRGRVSDEVFKLSLSPGIGKLPPRSGGVEHSDARDRRLYVRIRNRLTRIRPATPLSERLDARS